MKLKKTAVILIAACLPGAAFAAINGGVTTAGVNATQDYFANFKYTGLGNFTGKEIKAKLTGTTSAEFACFNNGDNIPQGKPFTVPPVNSEGTSTATVSKNGSATGSVILAGGEASSTFVCKGKAQLCQTKASFTNLNFSANIDGLVLPTGNSVPDQITTGKFNCQ